MCRAACGAFLCALLSLVSIPALPAGSTIRDITPADLEAFADGVILTSMEDTHVAGVVLGVVVNGEVVLLKGYGDADVEQARPVDPQTTLFRPGSVTKLFTWVALMQLKGQGKIDFETDINQYLEGVQVPYQYGPITIRHLMTHTPGFEDHVLGLFGRDETSLRPLVELLNDEMPTQVREPGTYASYSNHGVALAGLIVEQVSGEPWATYIENHILKPLGMQHTTMHQPLPGSLASHMSGGYTFTNGKFKPEIFEYVPAAPAGGASASGADMVRFMLALLNDGHLDGKQILTPELTREMRGVLFETAPLNNHLLHGFYEASSHGQFAMAHGGDTLWFHSELVLLPDADVGWFMSTNTQTGPGLRSAFHKAFMDRYFGPTVLPQDDFERTDLSKLIGSYSAIRHSHDDMSKLIKLLSAIDVAQSPEGELMLPGSETAYFAEIAPLTFQNVRGETRLSFLVDEQGNATHMYLSTAPVVAFEKLTGVHAPVVHNLVITLTIAVFLWVLVVWSIQRFNRRFLLPRTVAGFRLVAWWMAATVFAFLLGMATVVADANAVVFGLQGAVEYILLVPYLIVALVVASLLLCGPVLREASLGYVARFGYLIVAVTGLLFAWFMFYWQVL